MDEEVKCSTMASDIKGLTCMLIDGGEESLNVLERVCWYECDPQMFGGGGQACLEVKTNAGLAPA